VLSVRIPEGNLTLVTLLSLVDNVFVCTKFCLRDTDQCYAIRARENPKNASGTIHYFCRQYIWDLSLLLEKRVYVVSLNSDMFLSIRLTRYSS
jgi:hypothetical protein